MINVKDVSRPTEKELKDIVETAESGKTALTVKDLVQILQQMPQDANIQMEDFSLCSVGVVLAQDDFNNQTVCLIPVIK